MTSARPTIAYLTGQYPKVSHTFIQREIEGLRALGWTIEACTVRRPNPKDVVGPAQEAEQARTFAILSAAKKPATLIGAQVAALRHDPKRWWKAVKLAWKTRPPGLKAGLWQAFYFLEAAVLASHLRAKGVVHLHNHFVDGSCTVAMLTSEMTGIPYSFTMHGPTEFFSAHWWHIGEKVARASFVAAISHFCRSQLMYFSPAAAWDHIRIVHCGVTPALYGPHQPTPAPVVTFVGRLDAVKGTPLLIEAFARVAGAHPQARLSVIGDGPERAACTARVAELGIGDRVTFHGYRNSDEVADMLRQSDMLVLPSFAEGVPVVLMEAMASEIPVIASQVAGVGELVENGVSGFTIPAGDLDTLAARIDTLLSDPDLRARMGAAGRAKVEADFDLAKEVAWLDRILGGSLAGGLPAGLRPEAGDRPHG
ncbi:colanic acid biosynthesis glycosyltransferase WcaL [Sinirhodobacter populi]|uniref:Colanic acid biosynthesis glycosyltransferase WcaL n=1 Tax=Paenirhodobacter populi TaxID=2306993 RepID=A0A443KB18_9RHOB|nr:glycosyltransferase [Sinirhodobacter populi]RWR29833.1 colanic acid biosynthesis glycosyltransferase WcaL [Sinirhodobacter populi]